ncbi:DUF4376 domain-containing protein [Oceanimonas pelagia]|uniref:DUF4376 domain-containing protein n=1 Tax=Oceanimonas pelagia TaxID=3028314 RepID=A0AA50KM87_9GAMM|nr:DUF4376 domain-containing protein [Oceanimonas pelagia]WMC09497.1 DUF4376 domain-containing protein [Oceanimonas pelagia]
MIISHKSPDKSGRVNAQRHENIAAGFTWNGSVFDIDPDSMGLIASRALRLILDPDITELIWRSKDNQNITFTRGEFLNFSRAVDAHVESIYQQSWASKDPPYKNQ